MSLYDRLVRFFKPLIRFFFPTRLLNLPESLPEEGLIVCPNHISFFDPLFLAIFLPRNLTFMAKEELFSKPIIGNWMRGCQVIPLSRNGGDAAKLRLAVRELKNGKILAIFPQGHRCRYPLKQEDFQGGAGLMATLAKVRVLPVGIYAKNYKVRLFRKTYIQFGEPMLLEAPEEMGKKEQSLFITEKIYQEIVRLETMAREAAQ